MINTIIEVLKANKEISAYMISSEKVQSVELFYVTDKLETNRATNIIGHNVTVYHDFDTFRGSSECFISSSCNKEEIEEKIAKAVKRCKNVKNAFYELPSPKDTKVESIPSPISKESFADVACKCADAIFKANVYKEGWINSVEIFVTQTEKRLINSNGIDVSSIIAKIYIELIPTWKGEHEEVELYQDYTTSQMDYDAITKMVEETMLYAKARAEALKLPMDLKKCNVILKAAEASMIFGFFKSQLNYSDVFMKMNLFNIGDSVNDISTADPIDITLKTYVEGSASASSFDGSGVVLEPCHIIENSVCKSLHGSSRFGYYLKEKNPTGVFSNMEVKPGSMSYEDMKKEPHILCVYFSAPQVDGFSGYYGGEVRLGFYFDGKNYTPVTGFSVTGNLHEDKNYFRFSKEVETVSTGRGAYRGPKYLMVKDMTIS